MNRFDLVFPPVAPADYPEQAQFRLETTSVAEGILYSGDGGPALMTRTVKPGTSIRRLRNHRSAWPRRA